MFDAFSRNPDFINELGVKWWLDVDTTEYARKSDSFGTQLLEVTVFFIEKPSGERSRVIVDNGTICGEHQALEATACMIDVMKLLARDGSGQRKEE